MFFENCVLVESHPKVTSLGCGVAHQQQYFGGYTRGTTVTSESLETVTQGSFKGHSRVTNSYKTHSPTYNSHTVYHCNLPLQLPENGPFIPFVGRSSSRLSEL